MVAVTPTNVQKIEFDVTTAEGPSRVTVVTGIIPTGPEAFSTGAFSSASLSLTALVDPTLTPGQFRKATATAALATIVGAVPGPGPSTFQFSFSIDNVEATLDDESGRDRVPGDDTGEALSWSGEEEEDWGR
jgi:hypothetical protein